MHRLSNLYCEVDLKMTMTEKIDAAIDYLKNPSGKTLEDHESAVTMAVQALKEKKALINSVEAKKGKENE